MYPHTSHRNLRGISALALLLLSAAALWWWAPTGHTAAAAAPQITSLSSATVTRSGRILINGTGFGATQNGGRVGIGSVSAHVSRWGDTQIVAYVSEDAPVGGGFVRVINDGGASNLMPVEITLRPAAEGRVRWRFTVDGDYVPRRAAVGPDGTVYVNDVQGRLYALTPDGGLKWIFQAGLLGAMGSVSVGGDGTIYVGALVAKDPATPCSSDPYLVNVEGIFAVNPDGTQKWLFAKTCDGLLSGPDVGPDGRIHAVTDALGIGAFALNHDGTLGHAPTGRFGVDGSTGTEVVFGPAAPGQAPSQKYFQYESGGLYGYTLGGQRVFLYATNAVGITQPAVGQRTGTVYTVPDHQTAGRLFAVSPQGAQRWVSPIRPIHSLSIPDAPPSESAVYIVQDGFKLHRVNPEDGSVVWSYTDNNEQLLDPVASPDDRLVLLGGRVGLSQPGFFEAVSRDGQQLWKEFLPNEPGFGGYGQLMPSNRARFTADGRTAYIAADILGDGRENVYSYFYALNTADEGATPNTPPKVTMTSPAHNAEVSMGTRLDIRASAQDDGRVDRVEFFYGTTTGTLTLIGADTSADADGLYGVQFTPTTPGSHSFVAVAYDAAGLSGKPESSTNVWVTDRSPTVSWVAPTDGSGFAAPASITLVARAADPDGTVTGVEFKSYQTGVVGYNVIGSDTTPDAAGNYQIEWANPPQGTYEITATATDNSGLGRGAVITVTIGPASMPKYTIGGTVRDPGGSPLSGVNVTLGNSVSATATTGADGSYQFSDLQGGGSYTVTASRAGYSFSPSQHVFSGLGSNQAANFTGTRDTHAISGQIKDNNNVGLSEVALTVSDGQTTKTFYTSTNGNYSFHLPAGGNYTVTPTLVNYTFAPVSQSFNNLSAAQTANFTGTRNAHGISGRVLANGITLRGVTITLTGSQTGTATTDSSGYFSFNLPAGGTYTVTPSHDGYTFSPASLTFSDLSGNVTGSFTATSTNQPPRVTLTGPANGATFAAPATLTVSADSSDPDGTISKVEFFAQYKSGPFHFQTISLGSDTTAPYSATFTYSGADLFDLRAVATDDRGTWTPSEPVSVTFALGEASQTPGWQKQFAATRPGLNGAPFETLGFAAVDERHAWASHINAKVSRTTDGGLTWDTVEVQIDGGNNNHAQDVDFVDTQTGWVVGGEDNAVLRSTDGGRTFVRQPTGLSASLFGVEAVDVNTAFAVGHGYTERDGRGPVVLRTRDGGATWVEIAHPFRFLTRGSFYAVHFINQTTGWAVGGSGVAIKTTNGGSTWTDVSVPTTLPLSDVSFADVNNGWVVGHGGVIFRTADGGATWQQQNVGTGDAILSVSAVSPTVAWIACYGTPGFVARTADGGVTWHREYPDAAPNGNLGGVSSYSAVLFFNAERGWAAGYSGIYRRGAVATEPAAAYTLSGRVADGANAGLAGVTVTLAGAQSAETQTDAQGNYSFANLAAGGTYTVTPSSPGHTFTPNSRSFPNISADQTADFAAATTPTPTPTPTATPTPAPTPGSTQGIEADLTGAAIGGVTPRGEVDYELEGDDREFRARVEGVNLPAGTPLSVFVDGAHVGNLTVAPSLGRSELRLKVEDNQALPLVNSRTRVVVADAAGRTVLAGSFSDLVAQVPYPGPAPMPAPGANGELRIESRLAGAPVNGLTPTGAARFRTRDGRRDFRVEVERMNLPAGTTLNVFVDGVNVGGFIVAPTVGGGNGLKVGDLVVGPTLEAEFELETERGHAVPDFSTASTVVVTNQRGETLLSGVFNTAGLVTQLANDIDATTFFVEQQYRDFLGREADDSGLGFWSNDIAKCGGDAACVQRMRVNVSAAFFLSIEFQETGYLLYRFHKASFGTMPRRNDFLVEMQATAQGVVVGREGWELKLEENKRLAAERWTRRPEFVARYGSLTDEQYVDALAQNAGVAFGAQERQELLARLGAGQETRATVLRLVSDREEFRRRELNPAFVLMQYFGYLHRNPDEGPDSDLSGFHFWLRKLDDNGGDFRKAEMVRAFIEATEYRSRFDW